MLGLMSKNEYKDLVDFLGQRFEIIDQRFDQVDAHLDRLEENMADKVDRADVEEIVERISENKKKEVIGVIDAYAKRADDQWQEHEMLAGQTKRHQEWIEKIAEKTNTKLDY